MMGVVVVVDVDKRESAITLANAPAARGSLGWGSVGTGGVQARNALKLLSTSPSKHPFIGVVIYMNAQFLNHLYTNFYRRMYLNCNSHRHKWRAIRTDFRF